MPESKVRVTGITVQTGAPPLPDAVTEAIGAGDQELANRLVMEHRKLPPVKRARVTAAGDGIDITFYTELEDAPAVDTEMTVRIFTHAAPTLIGEFDDDLDDI